ncbi:chorismate lyase [Paraglaciecola sp. T6c]|uniref:Probable chorismate pyruvate-lyase n=1 Tax=Pseudoalteromonas atlantica (strain T6c / ATCC BAA-1087) TaxID=3042615 RepID=UBIC_PSEA6|nr:chorismate lyase [Paraglaciecola sp. T6c]Q15ZU0.1 RecName: Full=Probable chorismate pyruvate-lyase; Short=CL; Short=CPL [Paraglaciecola sp. T6c]ABG38598.1 chorismate lyase [Paraglaciecola sp. T6c]
MQKTISHAFPLGDVTWSNQGRLSIPNAHLESWLLNTGSLTQRLQTRCNDFKVQLVSQRQELATPAEYIQLGVSKMSQQKENWQVREVILHGDNQPWVFARSIIPQALCEADFLELGDKPLGHLIFNDDRFKRQPFQLMCLQPDEAFLHEYGLPPLTEIWGRRSVFCYQQYAMMVAELFLPKAPAYRDSNFDR